MCAVDTNDINCSHVRVLCAASPLCLAGTRGWNRGNNPVSLDVPANTSMRTQSRALTRAEPNSLPNTGIMIKVHVQCECKPTRAACCHAACMGKTFACGLRGLPCT